LKICADENVAPKLSALIREQLLSKGHTLETVYDYEADGVDDDIWVRKFAKAGGDAIIGGDYKMTTRPHEMIAIAETGLRVAVLDQRWSREKKNVQIAYLFYWWPHIEAVLATAGRAKCFKVPWGWGETKNTIKPLRVDVQGAYKKAARRGK
jgi:hypothetical protein